MSLPEQKSANLYQDSNDQCRLGRRVTVISVIQHYVRIDKGRRLPLLVDTRLQKLG